MIGELEKEYNRLYRRSGNILHLSGYGECLFEYEDVWRLLEDLPFTSLCDVGCGGGALLDYVLRRAKRKIVPLGVDYNGLAIRVIKNRIFPDFKRNFLRADFTRQRFSFHADVIIVMRDIMGRSFYRHTFDSRYLVVRKMMNASYCDGQGTLVLEPAMKTREDVEERLERNRALLRDLRVGAFEFSRCDPRGDYKPGDNWNIWALYESCRGGEGDLRGAPRIERLR